jgi:hypothetical protein
VVVVVVVVVVDGLHMHRALSAMLNPGQPAAPNPSPSRMPPKYAAAV